MSRSFSRQYTPNLKMNEVSIFEPDAAAEKLNEFLKMSVGASLKKTLAAKLIEINYLGHKCFLTMLLQYISF